MKWEWQDNSICMRACTHIRVYTRTYTCICMHAYALLTLQKFLYWINHEKLRRFNNKEVDHILVLLELSVLFVVGGLTDYIIEKIEEHFLISKYIIDIWLLAQELGLILLQDVCFAACLDRFAELPRESVNELSTKNFLELVFNTNLRCSNSELRNIVENWNLCNEVSVTEVIMCYLHICTIKLCIYFCIISYYMLLFILL